MGGEGDLLNRIQTRVAHMDDETLILLANPGLLRRAQKDLESTTPLVLGEENGKLQVRVGEALVNISEIPQDSTCDCPAGGICRHILGALLFLRVSNPLTSETTSCREEILTIDDEALRKWAGAALLRQAKSRLVRGMQVKIQDASPVVFTLSEAVCRWISGGNLNGMLCSCHSPGPCIHRVSSVLVYQIQKGSRKLEEVDLAPNESPGTTRSRQEVLGSVGIVLRELVSSGLSRTSSGIEQRFRTLAVSAHGVDLPRLEKLLRSLADEIALLLARDAQADTRSILSAAARAEALRCALANPTPSLTGVHRTLYEKVGTVDLTGMGARRWRSKTGYAGLTIYFWDYSALNWATWTDARPLSVAPIDPLDRYHQEGPWEGCNTPHQACRSGIHLSSAWRNSTGRLSGRPGIVARIGGPSEISRIPAVTRWSELKERAAVIFGEGFRDRNEQDELVLLAPAHWGKPRYDQIRQELDRPICDSDGWTVSLVLPNTPENVDAIPALERHRPGSNDFIFGMIRLSGDRIVVEPISIHARYGILNLTLDRAEKRKTGVFGSLVDWVTDADLPEEENAFRSSSTPLGLLLESLASELEMLAESGLGVIRNADRLRRLQVQADALGLRCVAEAITSLLDSLESSKSGSTNRPEALLRAYYILRSSAIQELIMTAGKRMAAGA